MKTENNPTTSICYSEPDKIYIRGVSLTDEMIGKMTFTEMIYFQITGRRASPEQVRILDAILVTLTEHGLTPSAIVSRLIYHSAPEALQSAVAAGVLGAGSTYLGTMEKCGVLLEEMLAAPEGIDNRAAAIVQRHAAKRDPVHGLGHPFHRPDDPRSIVLMALADSLGISGRYVEALRALARHADEAFGRHLTINATGATAALLGEIGMPLQVARGVAVIARAAGLVGHIYEEIEKPVSREMWRLVEEGIPYAAD